jgi:hypothetical protein
MTAGPAKTDDSGQVNYPEVRMKGSHEPDGTSHVNARNGSAHSRNAEGQDRPEAVDAPTGTAS